MVEERGNFASVLKVLKTPEARGYRILASQLKQKIPERLDDFICVKPAFVERSRDYRDDEMAF